MRLFVASFCVLLLGCQSFDKAAAESSGEESATRKVSSVVSSDRAARGTALHFTVTELSANQLDGTPVKARVGACVDDSKKSCLFLEGQSTILLADRPIQTVEIGLMGFHFPGKFEAIYVYSFYEATDDKNEPKAVLFIVDPNSSKVVASTNQTPLAGYTIHNSYFSIVKNPENKGFPFMAPGLHYLDVPYQNFLCIFDPKNINHPDQKCGTGFRSVSMAFKDKYWKGEAEVAKFRHNRGWLLDIDGDGWDDIHLPFFKYILSISGRTGKQLLLSLFDVAKATEPNVQEFFHHGRYYGGYTLFKDPKTQDNMTLLTAGSTVGSFANWNCNVSRYTAAIRWRRVPIFGHPYSSLAWSHYASFSNTSFTWDYKSVNSYFRKGDGIDKCIHRFSDSMIDMNGQPVMAYSQFEVDQKYDCEQEMFESAKNLKDAAAQDRMRKCMEENTKKSRGTWNIYTKNAATGAPVNSMPHSYLWGKIKNFLPDEGELLVIESFDRENGRVRFDKEGHVPESFSFERLSNGSWSSAGSVAEPGAIPKLDYLECQASQSGMQSSSPDASCGRPEFITRDIDGDGLVDFQLQTEKWIGYSVAKKKVVVKSGS